jgi:hypothetical protein
MVFDVLQVLIVTLPKAAVESTKKAIIVLVLNRDTLKSLLVPPMANPEFGCSQQRLEYYTPVLRISVPYLPISLGGRWPR